MSSDDLFEFEKVEELILPMRFYDTMANVFFGALQMDARDYKQAKERLDCPKDKQSFDYYEFLRDKADALPCSPDQNNPPLTKRSPQNAVLAIYLYSINSEKALAFQPANEAEVRVAARENSTYRVTAFMFYMHQASARKLLPAPRNE